MSSSVTVCGFGSIPSLSSPSPKVSRFSVRKVRWPAGVAHRSVSDFGSAMPALASDALL
jgi:hypothetical protein